MNRIKLAAAAAGATAMLALAGCGSGSNGASPASPASPASTGTLAPASASASPAAHHRAKHRHHKAAKATAHHSGCGAALWKHIYHPDRLHVVRECKTVRGRVTELRWEPDGDLHILLTARPALVNSGNDAYEHGDLVLEEICQGSVTQADAVAACQGVPHDLTVPSVGDKVTVTGSYVLDADHGWMEIHPVTSLTITGSAPAAPPSSAAAPPPPSSAPPAPAGCHPTTSSGNCYEPGEFCSSAEHGETGVAGDGKTITCENTDPGSTWHWV